MAESDKKLKLLVVDDESDNLDLLYRTFRQKFRVFRADSAVTALGLLRKEGEMAIIISDQRMPFMKGTELLQRTVEQFPDTVRIVLTGYTDVEDLVEAINTGQVFKYITKPWKPQELQDIVRQAADTYRAIKQRTSDLRRALWRESVFNEVMQAIRETLDYDRIENAIAYTFGRLFDAETSVLIPVSTVGLTNITPQTLSAQSTAYRFSQAEPADDAVGVAPMAPLKAPVARPVDSLVEKCLTKTDASEVNTTTVVAAEIAIQDADIACLETVLQSNRHQWSCCREAHIRCEQVSIPLVYQHQPLAVLVLKRSIDQPSWRPEDLKLLDDVAQQAALALSQAKLHQRVQAQTLRMQSELEFAREIQTSLLRQQLPELPDVTLEARCLPAREVGGDFYEVYKHVNSDDVWLSVGDVSGKGVPAALLMASAISVLRQELSQESPPAPGVIMQRLNQNLMSSLVSSNCLITMVLVRYSRQSSEITYANAGHIYPMVWSHAQVKSQQHGTRDPNAPPTLQPDYLKERGVPLGITADWQGETGRRSLESSDVVMLVSDGITEATAPSPLHHHSDRAPAAPDSYPEMLRHTGLWQLILRLNGAPNLDAILDYIQSDSNVREDDQTILAMEVLQS